MALSEFAVSDLLDVHTGQAVDLIRESARMVLQEFIEAEATDVVGAARNERTNTRTNERNESRRPTLATQAVNRSADPRPKVVVVVASQGLRGRLRIHTE